MRFKLNYNVFKLAILKNGLSFNELMSRSELSSSTITKVTAGKSCTAKTANKIAKALNVPVTDLFV